MMYEATCRGSLRVGPASAAHSQEEKHGYNGEEARALTYLPPFTTTTEPERPFFHRSHGWVWVPRATPKFPCCPCPDLACLPTLLLPPRAPTLQ